MPFPDDLRKMRVLPFEGVGTIKKVHEDITGEPWFVAEPEQRRAFAIYVAETYVQRRYSPDIAAF
ncbi:hypothetical protein [Rhizobium sp. TRM95796]|uniref:hypothetical protein n=1 Tax=Rhizobium sp. TRM95796 TaxID=2979862 RepID=UPI0021E6E6E3|nr:hypothetical protein [Rhizobium sp. TRM95796]MCV3768669.1 hypothetical protein [Rhizobium sp. TRM95796]